MEFIKWPKIPRLNRDMIITEKIDGTNACVGIEHKALVERPELALAVVDNLCIYAGSRKRWIIEDVNSNIVNDNFGWGRWVQDNAEELAKLGPGRHFGEWWGQGIQRNYGLKEKRFSLFNVSKWREDRPGCCDIVPILYEGLFDTSRIELLIEDLKDEGSFAAPGFMDPEGLVVFHVAANKTFKVTCENDETYKGDK
jgi:hypothetical protein